MLSCTRSNFIWTSRLLFTDNFSVISHKELRKVNPKIIRTVSCKENLSSVFVVPSKRGISWFPKNTTKLCCSSCLVEGKLTGCCSTCGWAVRFGSRRFSASYRRGSCRMRPGEWRDWTLCSSVKLLSWRFSNSTGCTCGCVW